MYGAKSYLHNFELSAGNFTANFAYCILMTDRMKKIGFAAVGMVLLLAVLFAAFASAFRRPCRKTVLEYSDTPALVFAVMKAESGFREKAVSEAGAVGLMQLMPATAQFVCEQNQMVFDAKRLYEGEYNVMLGCIYLDYLLSRFADVKTALAAYNAGEGVVRSWLKNTQYSDDGLHLQSIPYPETNNYVKKVLKYQKIYTIFD